MRRQCDVHETGRTWQGRCIICARFLFLASSPHRTNNEEGFVREYAALLAKLKRPEWPIAEQQRDPQ